MDRTRARADLRSTSAVGEPDVDLKVAQQDQRRQCGADDTEGLIALETRARRFSGLALARVIASVAGSSISSMIAA